MNKNYNKEGRLQFLFVVFIAVLYSALVLITTLPKNVPAATAAIVEKETNTVTVKSLDDIEKTFIINPIQEDSLKQEKKNNRRSTNWTRVL